MEIAARETSLRCSKAWRHMNYLLGALIANLVLVCLLQFLFLGQAERVAQRFAEMGRRMNTRPDSAFQITTNFWKEARQLNAACNDPMIAAILQRRSLFVAYASVSLVALAIVILSP